MELFDNQIDSESCNLLKTNIFDKGPTSPKGRGGRGNSEILLQDLSGVTNPHDKLPPS